MERRCSVEGCERPVYAKGICKPHAQKGYKITARRKNGGIVLEDRPTCCSTGCNSKAVKHDFLCSLHLVRYSTPINRGRMRGPHNHNWNGGVSEYPNHSELKRVRKAKLESVNYECQEKSPVCTDRATETHHKNGNRADHSWDNLQPVCKKCHGYLRRGQKHEKFKYGFSQKDIAAEIGVYQKDLSQLIKHGKASKPLVRKLAASKYAFLLARYQKKLPMEEVMKLHQSAA